MPLSGQTEIDSLKQELKETPNENIKKVKLLNQLGFEYWIIDSKKSITYGNKALSISKKIKNPEGQAKANRILGVAYWTQGEITAALSHLLKAKQKYTKLKDDSGLANVLLNTGMVYADIQDYDTAMEYYNKAIDKFSALGLKGRIGTTYTKIATILIEKGIYYEAKEYLENALKIHQKNDFKYGISEVHNRLALLYMSEGNNELAFDNLRKSIMLGNEINDTYGRINNLVLYGKLLRLDGDLDLSEQHLKLGLNKAKQHNLKKFELQSYYELKELKKEQDSFAKALMYYDHYNALKDSIFNTEKSKQLAATEFRNQLETKAKRLSLLQENEEKNKLIIWGLIVGGVLLSAITFLIFRARIRDKRKSKELLRKKQQLILSQKELTDTTSENARLKQKELEQKIEHKNRELTAYTLNFVKKNELIDELKKRLKIAKDSPKKEQQKIINTLYHQLKQEQLFDKDWEDFKRLFESVYIGFDQKLTAKYPELTANDLKLCKLIRLNLNSKEISEILGISPDSVKTARYRLRKKLSLESDEDLFSFLLQTGK